MTVLKILKLQGFEWITNASMTRWQKLFFSYKCFQLSAAIAIATFEIYG